MPNTICAVFVEVKVDAGIDRGLHRAFDHVTLQIDNDHRVRGELGKLHAGGFNDDQSGFRITARHIASLPSQQPARCGAVRGFDRILLL